MKVMKREGFIIGIDEVGRGSLAGPVAACATLIPHGFKLRGQKNLPRLRDSKRMSELHRKRWAMYARGESRVAHGVVFVSAEAVDRLNISRAADLAAQTALDFLIKKFKLSSGAIYLDAGLRVRAPSGFSVCSVIKGDDKVPAISLAAVLAKTERDSFMRALHFAYPRYGFFRNVGYGTKQHLKAIKKYGFLEVHRSSFCKDVGR